MIESREELSFGVDRQGSDQDNTRKMRSTGKGTAGNEADTKPDVEDIMRKRFYNLDLCTQYTDDVKKYRYKERCNYLHPHSHIRHLTPVHSTEPLPSALIQDTAPRQRTIPHTPPAETG